MTLLFFQNMVSPHQMPYIKACAKDVRVEKVCLIVPSVDDEERKEMGWDSASLTNDSGINLLVAPSDLEVEALYAKYPNAIASFTGIRAFPDTFRWFKLSLKHKGLKRVMISERPNTFAFGLANGKPLWLHRIRFALLDRIYAKHIDMVFAMGKEGVDYFRSVYGRWDVRPFCYCTETHVATGTSVSGIPRFCFVGSLAWWKNPLSLVKTCALIKSPLSLVYIGAGDEERAIKDFAESHNVQNVSILGYQSMSKVPSIMAENDVLVLPSIYDGWGAVVNEALQVGLYVICSDACGAKDLLQDERCGLVFAKGDDNDLAVRMSWCIDNIDTIRSNRDFRRQWAEQRISGKAVAEYFIDSLEGKQVDRPWA